MSDFLSRHPIFRKLSEAARKKLARKGKERKFRAGECLIRENEPNETLYLVLDGAVRIQAADGELIAVLREGAVIGEISTTGISLPVASAIAKEDVRVLAFPNHLVAELAEEETDFGEAMRELGMERVASRLFGPT